MRLKPFFVSGILVLLCISYASLHAQSRTHVFEGAEIIPVTGAPVSNGVLVIREGKIEAVGEAGSVRVPRNAERFDVSGKVIMPGLVDTHSHIGEGDGGDRSAALHPDVRILDTIDPRSKTFRKAVAGGLTSINIMPGSGLLMSGQTAYVGLPQTESKLRTFSYLPDVIVVFRAEFLYLLDK